VFALRELARARSTVGASPAGVLLRAALAVVFMFLIGIAHELLGITGVVFVAALFLVAFFVPHLYLATRRLWLRRRRRKAGRRESASPSIRVQG
jgi:hypothetical protein